MADPADLDAEYRAHSTEGATSAAAATDPDAEYAAHSTPAATSGDQWGALGKSTLKGAVDTGGPLAGAVMGGALGSAVAPGVGTFVGGLGGLAAGYLASRGADQALDLKSPEEYPPELRPQAYAGEFMGGALPFTGATIAAAKAGVRAGVPFIDKILDYAKSSPIGFGWGELSRSFWGGEAGAASESIRPGETGPRLGAEIAVGATNPLALLRWGFTKTIGGIPSVLAKMSPAGQQTVAGQHLQEIVSLFGEDPQSLAAILSKPELLGLDTSAAQKSGSTALASVEQNLAKDSTKFSVGIQAQADKAIAAMKNVITLLRGTGDPEAVKEAASVQQTLFQSLLSKRVTEATNEATQAAAAITTDTPQARAQLSTRAVELVEGALKDARGAESALWEKVPTGIKTKADSVVDAVADLKANMLPEESLPPIVEGFVKRMQGEPAAEDARAAAEALFKPAPGDEIVDGLVASARGEALPTTTGELKILRSTMLDKAREASAKGDYREARAYGKVAEAALNDLSRTFDEAGNDAFDTARQFSKELHDTFTRTFANDATAVTGSGADRVPPEVFLRKALGSGREAGDVRLQQLQDATEFMSSHGLNSPEAAARAGEMANAQERIIRLAASDLVDPTTGRLTSTKAAETFMRNNADILDRFPAARQAIEKAVAGEDTLKNVLTESAEEAGAASKQAFSKVLSVDSPTDAVAKAVASPRAESELTDMIGLAQRDGPKAVAGLRYSLVQNAITKAESGGNFFEGLEQALKGPMRDGLPSVLETMQKHGMMTADEVKNLDEVIAAGKRVLQAGEPVAALKGAEKTPNSLLDGFIRIIGSKIGGHVSEALMGGSTLIANSVGSKFFQEAFAHADGKTARAILEEAMANPQLTAALLQRTSTQAQQLRQAQHIHAYLLGAGLINAEKGADNASRSQSEY